MLQDLRVLDLGDANSYSCGRFLASLGAEVIHVEEPGGEELRRSPTPPALVNGCNTAYWQAQNIGKKSITLNLDCEQGISLCRELMTHCDFVIESFTPGYLRNRLLDYMSVSQYNPRVIFISITPFGQTGPYSHYRGNELIASAMGGVLDASGYANDTPVLEALDACTFHASAVAAAGAMIAHRERGISNKGQHIDCSIQETAASRNTISLIAYQFDRRKLARAGNCVRFGAATVRVIWELKDGYCFHSLMTGKFGASANKALSQWMGEEGFDDPMAEVDWNRYDRSALPAETRAIWEAAIARFFLSKTKDDIRTDGYQRGVRATVANTPRDVLNDPHLNARQFIQTLHHRDSPLSYPAYFIKSSNTISELPPILSEAGEHNDDVYREILGLSTERMNSLKQEGVI